MHIQKGRGRRVEEGGGGQTDRLIVGDEWVASVSDLESGSMG